jgi:DNA polymerase III sliding clamp (beta) subunit (PCNA family)
VIAQTKDLQRSVSLLGSIIERKNVIPILGNFKLNKIILCKNIIINNTTIGTITSDPLSIL